MMRRRGSRLLLLLLLLLRPRRMERRGSIAAPLGGRGLLHASKESKERGLRFQGDRGELHTHTKEPQRGRPPSAGLPPSRLL